MASPNSQILIKVEDRALLLGRGVRVQRPAGDARHPRQRVQRAGAARAQEGQARPSWLVSFVYVEQRVGFPSYLNTTKFEIW